METNKLSLHTSVNSVLKYYKEEITKYKKQLFLLKEKNISNDTTWYLEHEIKELEKYIKEYQ